MNSCYIPHCERNASVQLISRTLGENHVDLGGSYYPSPQGDILGISGQNLVEVPASLLVPVPSRRTVQSPGPGGSLRKARFISALVSSHCRRPTQGTGPSSLCPTKWRPLLPTQRVCRLWAFPVQLSCFSKASGSITTLTPTPLPHHPQTLRFIRGIWLVRLFLSFQSLKKEISEKDEVLFESVETGNSLLS